MPLPIAAMSFPSLLDKPAFLVSLLCLVPRPQYDVDDGRYGSHTEYSRCGDFQSTNSSGYSTWTFHLPLLSSLKKSRRIRFLYSGAWGINRPSQRF
jgi:hypothetical protein